MKGVPLLNLDKIKSLDDEERVPAATRADNQEKKPSPIKKAFDPKDEYSPIEELMADELP